MNLPELRDSTSTLELKELQVDHEKIIQLKAMGMSRKDIAVEMRCSVDKVGYTLNGGLGSAKLDSILEAAEIETIDIASTIHQVAEKAIKLMGDVVSGEQQDASIRDRLDVAKQVLHMDGYAPVQKQVIDVTRTNAEKVGLVQIRDRAKELRLLRKPDSEPKVIEADFQPVIMEKGEMPVGL